MHTMHLLPGVAIQPNFELKTRPKQLLGSLLLVIVLPGYLLLEITLVGQGCLFDERGNRIIKDLKWKRLHGSTHFYGFS